MQTWEPPLKDTRILHEISFNVKLYLQYLWHYDFEIFKEQCSIYAGSRRGVPREVLKISLAEDFFRDDYSKLLTGIAEFDSINFINFVMANIR